MAHRVFPHGALQAVADGLWQVSGTLPFPLTRNMTVIRLADASLLLHSVVALDEPGMKALEALGRPAWLLAPHPMHLMDAPFYRERYPDSKIVAAADAAARLAERNVRVDATPDEALPALGLRHHVVPGLKYTEVVLDVAVPGGRALVFTDLVARAPGKGLFMKILGPPGGTGTPRIVRFRQVADKKAVRAYLREHAARGDLRLVLGAHGEPILEDAASVLGTAATNI